MKTFRALLIVAVSILAYTPSLKAQGYRDAHREAFYQAVESQLTVDQKQQLDSAATWQEKRVLLQSWGIKSPWEEKMKNLDPAIRAKIQELQGQMRAAATPEEKQAIRQQIHALFRQPASN